MFTSDPHDRPIGTGFCVLLNHISKIVNRKKQTNFFCHYFSTDMHI